MIKYSNTFKFIALLAMLPWTTTPSAHIVLEQKAAPVGSTYKAVFQVGHGCQGAATTALRVRIPAGFKGAKPMPKAGWSLSTDPDAITWTANNPASALSEAHYDEFVLRGRTPDAPGPLWFAVRQSCGTVVQDWADVPASGLSTEAMKSPAALLQVTGTASTQAAAPTGIPTASDHRH